MIRAATAADAAAIADIYAGYVRDGVATLELTAPTAAQMAERIGNGLPWLVHGQDRVDGYACATPHHVRAGYRWSVNVSVYLRPEARGRGVGRALYGVLLPVLGRLGYVRAFAGVTLPNPASVGLHESMGFTPVGIYHAAGFKLGAWHDVGWWECALAEPAAVPVEPRVWHGEL